MTNTQLPLVRPPFSLDPAGRALATDWFAGFRLQAFPALAYAHEPVVLKLLLDRDLEEYECRFSIGYTAWEPWQPARPVFVRTIGRRGESVTVCCQLRTQGVESPIAVTGVAILSEFSLRPAPGALLAVTVLEQGDALAVACQDGALYWNRRTGEQHYVRTGHAGATTTLVSPDGKIVTQHLGLGQDAQGRHLFHPEVSVHDLYTGLEVRRFSLEESEEMRGFTAGGDLITRWRKRPTPMKWWRGEPVMLDETPYFTRLWDLEGGEVIAEYAGVLMDTSQSGVGAVAYFFNDTLTFREHYRHQRVRGTYYLTTLRGGTSHTIRLSPSGSFAAVTAVTPIRQGAFTFNHTTYEIVRTLGARRLAALPEKITVTQFVSDDLLWMVDHAEEDPARKLKLYDWTAGKVEATLPIFAILGKDRLPDAIHAGHWGLDEGGQNSDMIWQSARQHDTLQFLEQMQFCFAADPVMPDLVVALCKTVQGVHEVACVAREDDYSQLHLLPYAWPRRNSSQEVVATSRRVYASASDQTIRVYDLVSGESRQEIKRDSIEPPSDTYRSIELVARDEIVLLTQASNPIQYWGRNDRTDEALHWIAGPGTVSADLVDSDGEAILLWAVDLGDPQQERAHQAKAMGHLGYVISSLLAGSSAPEQKAAEKPPRLHGLCIWNHRTDETHLVALPQPCRTTCYVPERECWLVYTMHSEDDIDKEAKKLVKRTVYANVYSVSLQGEKDTVLSYEFEPFIDERVKSSVFPSSGEPYTQGKIYEPALALSRAQPGQLAYYNLDELGMIDVFSQQIIWQCPNPVAYKYGVPNLIIPLPGDRVWARFDSHGAVVIDSRGQIDPGQVRPYHAWQPALYASAIVYADVGLWRPLARAKSQSIAPQIQE